MLRITNVKILKQSPLRILSLMLVFLLILPLFTTSAETLQNCHKVILTKEDTTAANKSVIREWIAQTVLPEVDEELAAIRRSLIDEIVPTLKAAKNKTSQNSRLDVETRYSRTGLRWLSFVIQARVTYHRGLIDQKIVTRTYDMTTGSRVTMADLFGDNEDAWILLASAVQDQITAYFPDLEPDEGLLADLCSREALEQADFSLHGMSLVLHYVASDVYPGKHTLMEVTLFYPQIRPYMTEEAKAETDNLTYYKTCALTFDDGPSRTNTTLVLNNLMLTGSRATFFVIGNLIEKGGDLIQKEHDNGHAIGGHNWSHTDARKVSTATLRSMPGKIDKKLNKFIGIPSRYDRVPYGLYPQMIKAKVGWPLIQWSVDTYDWRGRSTSAVLGAVKKKIHDGAIILCHDIKDKTPASAKAICEWLAENGYILLTVDELFAKDGVALEPDTVYFRCEDGETSIKK